MFVTVNYRDKIAAAYKRGVSDAYIYKMGGPKPDVERYLAELNKRPTVAKL